MRESTPPTAIPSRGERWIVAAVVTLAMLRVFLYSNAFPFFNNVDEHLHFDLVVKYARGFLPGRHAEGFDRASAEPILDWGSWEFNHGPEKFAGGAIPLPHAMRNDRPDRADRSRRGGIESLLRLPNAEAESPPFYYAVAAGWWRLGGMLGLGALDRLYWLRWLSVVTVGAFVATSYAALRRWYPDRPFVRLGVPILLAVYPNDFQYGVNNDVLAPMLGAAGFLTLLQLEAPRRRPIRYAVATGLLLAAAMLTKYTNLPLLLLAGTVSLGWMLHAVRSGAARRPLASLGCLWVAALTPVALWMIRNLRVLGDVSGAARKMELLRWHYKSLGALGEHPLLSLDGWYVFLTSLFANFWGGEIGWHGRPLHRPWLDALYAGSSLLFVALAAGAAFGRRETATGRVERLAVLVVAAAVVMLAALSMVFQFNMIFGPSREFPYFTSGRLVAGILLPFALLYVLGIETLCRVLPSRLAAPAAWGGLLAVVAVIALAEFAIHEPVFASPSNWFHAP